MDAQECAAADVDIVPLWDEWAGHDPDLTGFMKSPINRVDFDSQTSMRIRTL